MTELELYQMVQAEAERDGEKLTAAEIEARAEKLLHFDPKTQRKMYEMFEEFTNEVRKNRTVIICDEETRDRIIKVFKKAWPFSCFFGHMLCGAFNTENGPDCENCIKQRAGWIIREQEPTADYVSTCLKVCAMRATDSYHGNDTVITGAKASEFTELMRTAAEMLERESDTEN